VISAGSIGEEGVPRAGHRAEPTRVDGAAVRLGFRGKRRE
jgi:hypothetical protein